MLTSERIMFVNGLEPPSIQTMEAEEAPLATLESFGRGRSDLAMQIDSNSDSG